MKNKSVDGAQLLIFLYSIIERGVKMATKIKINDEKEKRDYGARAETDAVRKNHKEQKMMNLKVEMFWTKGYQLLTEKKTIEISGRVLAAFGLQCFKKALKHKKIVLETDDKQELIARLDPFVSLILMSFKTYHNPIITSSLHIMTQITPLGLPTFTTLLTKFLNRIFKLFESTHGDWDFVNSLFKCTSELIKTYSIYKDLSDVQLRTLMSIISDHLDRSIVQSNALQCFKSVVHRKFLCSEIYDLVERVQEMMINSSLKPIRNLC